jgi:hypothetical protein
MDAQPYTNREMDMKFAEIKDILLGQNEQMGEIKAQVKTTNGRVSSLEKWKIFVIGFCTCITVLMIPLLIALITSGKL